LTLRVGMAVVLSMDVDFDFTVTRLAKIANTNNLWGMGDSGSPQRIPSLVIPAFSVIYGPSLSSAWFDESSQDVSSRGANPYCAIWM